MVEILAMRWNCTFKVAELLSENPQMVGRWVFSEEPHAAVDSERNQGDSAVGGVWGQGRLAGLRNTT